VGTSILPKFEKLQEKQKTKYLNRFLLVTKNRMFRTTATPTEAKRPQIFVGHFMTHN